MRILYISLSYVPSRRASSVQVMKMCAALARRGHDVVLLAKPGDLDTEAGDHHFYRVEHNFVIEKVPRPAGRGGGVVFAAGVAASVLRRRRWADLVYCRDVFGALIAAELGLPVMFEAHGVPTTTVTRRALSRVVRRRRDLGMVAITDALRADLVHAGLAPSRRPILVSPDACDPPATAVAHRKVGSPPTVGYVGNLYPGRGIETIVALAREMPDVRFRVVGGSTEQVADWRDRGITPNLELLGFRPQAELPALYATFDLVLMPHAREGVLGATGASDISRWTSPMKMFEYMASGVAMIASDLPVLQEVLRDGENAVIAPSGRFGRWRAAIEEALADDDLRFRLARRAQEDVVNHYTWDARARSVQSEVEACMRSSRDPG